MTADANVSKDISVFPIFTLDFIKYFNTEHLEAVELSQLYPTIIIYIPVDVVVVGKELISNIMIKSVFYVIIF